MNYGHAILASKAKLEWKIEIATGVLLSIAKQACTRMGPEQIDCLMMFGRDDLCTTCASRMAQIEESEENATTTNPT